MAVSCYPATDRNGVSIWINPFNGCLTCNFTPELSRLEVKFLKIFFTRGWNVYRLSSQFMANKRTSSSRQIDNSFDPVQLGGLTYRYSFSKLLKQCDFMLKATNKEIRKTIQHSIQSHITIITSPYQRQQDWIDDHQRGRQPPIF